MCALAINNPKILDNLLSFNSRAGLFINNIKENEENPVFIEPNFDGYSLITLSGENWGPATQEEYYMVSTYNDSIYWTNNEDKIEIKGYFIKNLNGDTLWFYVFDSPIEVNQDETIQINPKIHLNYREDLETFFIFKIVPANTSSTTVLNPEITFIDQKWGEVNAEKSLINTVTGDYKFNLNENSIVVALNQKIKPTADIPFSFKIKIQQSGFFVKIKNINIVEPGVYETTIKIVEAA